MNQFFHKIMPSDFFPFSLLNLSQFFKIVSISRRFQFFATIFYLQIFHREFLRRYRLVWMASIISIQFNTSNAASWGWFFQWSVARWTTRLNTETTIYCIKFAYMVGFLQVPSDDLPDGRLSLRRRTSVHWHTPGLHPGTLLRPAQVQVGGRRVCLAGVVGGTGVFCPHSDRIYLRLSLCVQLVEAIVLRPAAQLADFLWRQEAAGALGPDGAVKGLGAGT